MIAAIPPEYLADAAANYNEAIAVLRQRREREKRAMARGKKEILKWRSADSLVGYASYLRSKISTTPDEVVIDLKAAQALVEICLQAAHTEKQNEPR